MMDVKDQQNNSKNSMKELQQNHRDNMVSPNAAPNCCDSPSKEMELNNLIKSNIFYIDGTNLSRSCLIEVHPEPYLIRIGLQTTRALTHTDSRNDQFTKYLKEIIFRCYPVSLSPKLTMTDTLWHFVKKPFNFQIDNLYNQFDDVTHTFLVMGLREIKSSSTDGSNVMKLPTSFGSEIMYAIVEEYHSKLFDNYLKWTDYMNISPFPWGSNEIEYPWTFMNGDSDMKQMLIEIILYRLIWGEASNLRHTPELLCFLFHWCVMAWRKSKRPVDGEFVDLIGIFIERIKDEAWHGSTKLKPPDHSSRLNYDDMNELFWESSAISYLKKLARSGDVSLSVGAITNLLPILTKSNTPGKSVKTFIERRSYPQVLRTYFRTIHFHYFLLQLMFWAQLWWAGEPPSSLQQAWGVAIFTAVFLSAMRPFLDLSLFKWRSLTKRYAPCQLVKNNISNCLRVAFLSLSILVIYYDSATFQSHFFNPTGLIGFSYLTFYGIHGIWPFLHLRLFHRMPLFSVIWCMPGLRWLLGPSTFVGGTALLADDFQQLIRYSFFWFTLWACKLSYWFFLILPESLKISKYFDAVDINRLACYNFVLLKDYNHNALRICFWCPIYLLWFFDTQIFFLLFGSFFSTILGYLRRVGYVQNLSTIQKQIFPLVPAAPLFVRNVGAMASPIREPDTTDRKNRQRKQNDRGDTSTSSRILKRTQSTQSSGFRTPRQGGLSTPVSTARPAQVRIAYTDHIDPYTKLIESMNATSLANGYHLSSNKLVDDSNRYRKCFGFVWNEIVQTWREEDIINNRELWKLQFNEIPAFFLSESTKIHPSSNGSSCRSLGLTNWEELRSNKLTIVWDRSTVRLPVYVYADLVTSLLKSFENYQLRLCENALSLHSRTATAKRFFKKYLSVKLNDQIDTNLHSCLPLEGLREIIEAFFMYLSRYFSCGSLLVKAIENLWSWISDDPARLILFNLLAVQDLKNLFIRLFSMAQETRDITATEMSRNEIEKLHQKIKIALRNLVNLEREAVGMVEIKDYLKALDLCFNSKFTYHRTTDPPAIDTAEVNSLALKIQQMNILDAFPATSPICLFGIETILLPYLNFSNSSNRKGSLAEEDIQLPSPPTLKRHHITELRALFKIESGAFLPHDIDGILKLSFRRAHHILTVSQSHLETSEGQRRFIFFMNSLLMKMPFPPEVLHMVSMSSLTPYFREECFSDIQDLQKPTQEGVAKMELLRSLFPTEFDNFLERTDSDHQMFNSHQQYHSSIEWFTGDQTTALKTYFHKLEKKNQLFQYIQFYRKLQNWCSARSQVLSRTVRGIMYYEKALQILSFIESKTFERLHLSHDLNRLSFDQKRRFYCSEASLWKEALQLPPPYMFSPSAKSLAKIKYHYVLAAQEFGKDRLTPVPHPDAITTSGQRAALMRKNGIINLLQQNPNLRVATIEEEFDSNNRPTGRVYSVLYRWSPKLFLAAPKSNKIESPSDSKFDPFPSSASTNTSEASSAFPDKPNVAKEPQSEMTVNQADIRLIDNANEIEKKENWRPQWFQTEPQDLMSPPSDASLKESDSDSNEGRDTQISSPIGLTGGLQSPLRLRHKSIHRLNKVSQHHHQHERTPSELENCQTPQITANLEEDIRRNGNLEPKLFRKLEQKQFGRLHYAAPLRFSPILSQFHEPGGFKMADDSKMIRKLLKNTPLNAIENDSLLISNSPVQMIEDEIHLAPLTSSYSKNNRLDLQTLLNGELQVVYKILLPTIRDDNNGPWRRNPLIGPGKPENQNHSIIFTRGETVQAIDMNMDGYLEEAMKLRNLLQEFTAHPRMRILGFREHIFSLDVSSISSYMALQELSFVTNHQRFFHTTLNIRMHYGHPDVFDRFFVACCGNMSKASNGINLSEDVFAGYNATQRGYSVHHIDYKQVGKGRDVGLQQIFMFEKKVAGGNAEQILSRDMRRMCDKMDFLKMLSIFYSGPGFFCSNLLMVFAIFASLYAKVFLSVALQTSSFSVGSYWTAIILSVTTIQLQLGMFLLIPIVLLISLEKGFTNALKVLSNMLIKFAIFFYNFAVGTKAAEFDRVLVYGGAKYHETGRGFQISHGSLILMWKFYYFTHFQVAIEFLLLLLLYWAISGLDFSSYVIDTWLFWILFFSFTSTPFIFNPLGSLYPRLLDDLRHFQQWMTSEDLQSNDISWRAWWREEMDQRSEVWWHNRLFIFFRLLRFIFLSFGLATVVANHYNHSEIDTFIYIISIFLSIGILIVFMTEFKLVNPGLNRFLAFSTALSVVGTLCYVFANQLLTTPIFVASVLAFTILVYGITRLILVLSGRTGIRNPLIEVIMSFDHTIVGHSAYRYFYVVCLSVVALNSYYIRFFHYIFAFVIFFPIFLVASLTSSFHDIQTRVLFNEKFVGIINSGLIKKGEAEKKGHL